MAKKKSPASPEDDGRDYLKGSKNFAGGKYVGAEDENLVKPGYRKETTTAAGPSKDAVLPQGSRERFIGKKETEAQAARDAESERNTPSRPYLGSNYGSTDERNVTSYYAPRRGKFLNHLNALTDMVGERGEKLPEGASSEFRDHIGGLIRSARLDHEFAYAHATGQSTELNSGAALNRVKAAHESLQSAAYALKATYGNSRSFKNQKFERAVAAHGQELRGLVSDQVRYSSKVDGKPTFDPKKSNLQDESLPLTAGPYAGTTRTDDFRTPDSRRPGRGQIVHVATQTAARSAGASAPGNREVHALGTMAMQHSAAYANAVRAGDRDAAEQHGRATLGYLDQMHKTVKDSLSATHGTSNAVVAAATKHIADHVSAARVHVASYLGER